LESSLGKADWDKIKKETDQLKDFNAEKFQNQMKEVEERLKDLSPRIEEEMEKAKGQIEKAKLEMQEYKGFVDGLQSDGLINKKENYSIKHKNGELFINGKKASNEIYNKYRSFLEKHHDFKIEKDGDDFNIDKD